MTEKEMKKISKTELVSILITQSKEIDRLKRELAQKKAELEQRRIMISNAGSIAEASLEIFKVMEAAQRAADTYLENLYRMGTAGNLVAGNGIGTVGTLNPSGNAAAAARAAGSRDGANRNDKA